jgi:hypothetical protein
MKIQVGDKFYWRSGDIITLRSINRTDISYAYNSGNYYHMPLSDFHEFLKDGKMFPLTPLLEALL